MSLFVWQTLLCKEKQVKLRNSTLIESMTCVISKMTILMLITLIDSG